MKPLYCLVYTFIFMGYGVMSTLIGPYLHGIGFTGEQIGMVTAAGTCTVVFASPFWGHRYSVLRSRNGRYLLVALVFCGAAATGLLLSQVTVFVGFLALFMTLNFFQSPSTSLMDTLTIDDGEKFGQVRTFGAAGFAVASFGAASLADAAGLHLIFPTYTACLLAGVCMVLLIRRQGEKRRAAREGQGMPAEPASTSKDPASTASEPGGLQRLRRMAGELAGNRQYVLLLICAFFINGTDIANNTFFGFLYLEGGGVLAGVGLAFLLMAGSEAPFMAASDWLCERFGQGRILLIAMIFSIVRFGLFAMGLPSAVLIALFPLQGLVNGITLVEFVKFVARVIPQRLRGFGIAVYYAMGSSLSTIICQLIGGHLLDHGIPGLGNLFGSTGLGNSIGSAGSSGLGASLALSGPQSVYLFFAVFNIAGVVIFLAAGLHRK